MKRGERKYLKHLSLRAPAAHLLCILVGHQSPMQTYCTGSTWKSDQKETSHFITYSKAEICRATTGYGIVISDKRVVYSQR